jgi:hypothetical protein
MEAFTMTNRDDLSKALAIVFGREWLRLSHDDQGLIVRDCTEEGGVTDLYQYRRNIGTGNLESYARVMRVRFAPVAKR